jgi:hypothetical protein
VVEARVAHAGGGHQPGQASRQLLQGDHIQVRGASETGAVSASRD